MLLQFDQLPAAQAVIAMCSDGCRYVCDQASCEPFVAHCGASFKLCLVGKDDYLTTGRQGRSRTTAGRRTWILGALRNASVAERNRYSQPVSEGCAHCGVTASSIVDELGPHWLGHNTQRVCKVCGKRWCTELPRECWEPRWSLCSPDCKRAWYRGTRRVCVVCGSPMPGRRADAKTCSGRCRVALHRASKG